jgi:hypothetical protein
MDPSLAVIPVPEVIVAVLAAASLTTCIWAWREGEEEGLSWGIWCLITTILYAYVQVAQPNDVFRRGVLRLDVIAAVANVAYWRIVYIRRARKARRMNAANR